METKKILAPKNLTDLKLTVILRIKMAGNLKILQADLNPLENQTYFNTLSRNGIFWACATCIPRACKQVLTDTSDEDETNISSHINKIETNLETKLAKVVKEEIPKAIKECLQMIKEDLSSTVQNNITRLSSQGVDFPPHN